MRRIAIALAASVCLLVVSAVAQNRVGTITGTVVDRSGATIPGATIELTAPRVTKRTTISDANGAFTFEAVPVGAYTVIASLAGFRTAALPVQVRERATEVLQFTLDVSGVEETISVHADSPTVSTKSSSVAGYAGGVGGGAYRPGSPRVRRNTESYNRIDENGYRFVKTDPLSTFSIDVDTASYANVRRFLSQGSLPPADAVRVEELINYFRFDYPEPTDDAPFSVTTEIAACPWNAERKLALIGLQARKPDPRKPLQRNLVFLLDVSGSMADDDKLPLVRTAMRMLVDTLDERDRVAIVVYAGASGLVLPSTPGDKKDRIHAAIGNLDAGGSTNGAAGITLAYQVAQDNFIKGGINRVILATDGDFNVGVTSQSELVRLIEQKREAGVFLSVLGVGTGNLKDSTMEQLADKGNGNYSYLDSLHEARKVLIAEAGATLTTIAKDVKIQVEFNPAHVAAYRLIGYENRLLANEDFNNDKKDAGEIGAGHTVTALYEIVPHGAKLDLPSVDPLKYQPANQPSATSDELMTVKLRYKQPDGDTSKLMTVAVRNTVSDRAHNVGFAAAVAEFGMLLRKSESRGSATWAQAAELARRHRGTDEHGYRAEFIRLVELAASLTRVSGSQE